ncbi:MAG: hypothetical protein ACR2RV_22890, partial [Verrucomicrobiales bacterium]
MKLPLVLLITAFACGVPNSHGAPLDRARVTAVPAGSISFESASLAVALAKALAIATSRQIPMQVDGEVAKLVGVE